MIQKTLSNKKKQTTPNLLKPYSKGAYNKYDNNEQWIRISEGCPNKCPYCRESYENGTKPIYYDIPEIVRNKVKILDMNLLYKEQCINILKDLGSKRANNKVIYYELVCGIDYRYLTQDIANNLKHNRFINIRIAWDWGFNRQYQIKKAIDMLKKAGFSSRDVMIFMICNWKIPFSENMRKLDLCKVWRVKVADCWFDNQLPPKVKPIHWDADQIKKFRANVRKHNQLINFGIDPEVVA